METFSITIRPRLNNFKIEWMETLRDYLDTKRPDCDYIIGGESGNADSEINHIQMSLKTNQRNDNIKRMIKTVLKFEPEDRDEKACWLKCNKSDDPAYTNGYCVKEKKMVYSNFSLEQRDEFYEYYKACVDRKKNDKGWECKGINELPYYLKKYMEETISDNEFEVSMRALAYKAFGEGKLPFSLVRKIKKSDEIIFKQLICPINYSALVNKIRSEDDE